MMKVLRFCCLAIGASLAGQAWAGGCQLNNYGNLQVEMIEQRATIIAKVNGTDTRFILDTGAFFNTMSNASATALKLKPQFAPFGLRITGVGGDAKAQVATVKEFGIIGTTLHDVDFVIAGSDAGRGLVGANVLEASDLEIDLAGGKLNLFKAEHCDNAVLAYWVKDGGDYNVADLEPSESPTDLRTFLTVLINGKKVRALIDSGATATVLSRSAAERAGIDLKGPDVKAAGESYGLGSAAVKTWVVPVDSFSVGTETIRHSQMEVIDGALGDGNDDSDADMLLGVDFLLAHHMYIANAQEKAYFTYNGGRVFSYADAPGDNDKSDVDAAADGKDATPKSASDYALLGEAHLSRGETKAAIADLNEAIRMTPDQANYYVALARAQNAIKQSDAALASLDKSLSLDPKNVETRLFRAELRMQNKDRAGAVADVSAAVALVPTGSAQAYQIAVLYVRLGQPAAALPVLDDWIRLHEDDSRLGLVLNERCWARGLSNQMLDEALEDCRKAIRLNSDKAYYFDSLGMVQLRLGHYPESIDAYQKALAKNPDSAWSHYGRGLAELISGQVDAGNADLAAVHKLDPEVEVLAAKYGVTKEALPPVPPPPPPAAAEPPEPPR